MGRTYNWNGNRNMPISRPELTDSQVAGMIRMLTRNDLGHESAVCIARDRIMGLHKEKGQLEKENTYLKEERRHLEKSLEMFKGQSKEKENEALREFKEKATPILKDLWYWDTCPSGFKLTIEELTKQGGEV
jgi:hypothetical protein